MASADTEFGAFTEDGPWDLSQTVRCGEPAWLGPGPSSASSLPALIRPRTLPPWARVGTTVRHLGGALGHWYLTERRRGGPAKTAGISRRLRVAAEQLGPTYIKLGQIVASGDGIFPAELVAEFKWCRDKVPPEPWPVIHEVIAEELGVPSAEVFASIDHEPLAAASIAQVHRARLLGGTEVVIKVQRPSVARRVHQDLAVMAWLAPHLVGRIPIAALANPPALVELFAETIVEELDFRLEAENMLDIASTFAELGQRDFVVPRPHPTLVTRRMLVMERLAGFNFSDVEGMRAAGVDTDNGGAQRHGRVSRGRHDARHLPRRPPRREPLRPAVGEDRAPRLRDHGPPVRVEAAWPSSRSSSAPPTAISRSQVAALRDLGALPPDTDIETVIAQLGLDRPPMDPTHTQRRRARRASSSDRSSTLLALGARMPKELMLFVKNLVFLDGAIATLAPDLDLFEEIEAISLMFAEKHGERIMQQLGLQRQA